jgi:ribosomal-protein-alanine N-acetyltransferase
MKETAAPAGVLLRPMSRSDVARVVEIETEAFTSPWQEDTFAGLLDRPGVELLVLEHEADGIVGYAVLWCVVDQGELANVAVVPGRRGQGLGRWLVGRVLDIARARGLRRVYLEVRSSNERAARIYDDFGFREVGVRRDYYDQPREDARILMVELG